MNVADWLHGLGLAHYEQAFRKNDIDAEVLLDLTEEDLVALGIEPIGHRRKLLAAIAQLRSASPPQTATSRAEGGKCVERTRPAPGCRTAAGHGPVRGHFRLHEARRGTRRRGGAQPTRPFLRRRRCQHRRPSRNGRQAHRGLRHGRVRRSRGPRGRPRAMRPRRYSTSDDACPRSPPSSAGLSALTLKSRAARSWRAAPGARATESTRSPATP